MRVAFKPIPALLVFSLFHGLVLASAAVASEPLKHDGGIYEVIVTTAGKTPAGTATIAVNGKAGYHCNTLYPWKLTLRTAAGERVIKKEQAKVWSQGKVVFEVASAAIGSTTAELKLSVCDDKQCKMEKVELRF